jgi:hypothetical protein
LDLFPFGTALPDRSRDRIGMDALRTVAIRS